MTKTIMLSETGISIGAFDNEHVEILPGEMYDYKNNILLTFSNNKLISFYDFTSLKLINSFEQDEVKQIELTNSGELGGVLTYKKELLIFNHSRLTRKIENVLSFSISDFQVGALINSDLHLYETSSNLDNIRKFKGCFYFKIFRDFLFIARKETIEAVQVCNVSIYKDRELVKVLEIDKIEKIDVKADMMGNFLFIITSQYTSNSYYGKDNLYFYNFKKNRFVQIEIVDPPLYFAFLTEERFVVCSDHQPSTVSVYNYDCSIIGSFPKSVRNRVFYNPHGNLVAFCGFENLSGNIEIIDTKTKKPITKFKVLGASLFSWSPCGTYFMVSITNNMRTGNKVLFYDYFGKLIMSKTFESLVKSEVVGERIPFVRLEIPKELRLEEETVYKLPNSDDLVSRRHPKLNKAIISKKITKTGVPIAQPSKVLGPNKKPARTIEDVKNDLKKIDDLKVRQNAGEDLSMRDLNLLLKESGLREEMSKFN